MSNILITTEDLTDAREAGNKELLRDLAKGAWAQRNIAASDIADATGYSKATVAGWPRPAVVVEYNEPSEPVVEEPTPEPAPEVVKEAVTPFKGVNYKNANDARIARNGYLSALQDIAHALAEGGEGRVAQWIQDNGAGKVVLGVDFPA